MVSRSVVTCGCSDSRVADELVEVEVPRFEATGSFPKGFAKVVVEARPVEVEELVEGADLLAPLHHGRSQRVLEDRALVDRQLVKSLEGVDRLGGRHPDPALAQDVRELEDLLLHAGS